MLLYQKESWTALLNPIAIGRQFHRHRGLLWEFIWRNIELQHKGSVLGLAWSVMSPLLLFGTYAFVFLAVFDGRFGVVPTETRTEYAIGLFLGLVMLQFFQETMTGAPSIVVQNPNYVKKVVFPLEILPAAAFGAAFFRCIIALSLVVIAAAISGPGLTTTVWWLPVLIGLLAIFSLGVAWILSALGVFLRDLAPLMQFCSALLVFVSGVFYSVEKIPPAFSFLRFNPLLVFVDAARGALLWQITPATASVAWLALISVVTCLAGHAMFRMLKPAFADVI